MTDLIYVTHHGADGSTETSVARAHQRTQWRSRIKGGPWDAWENGRYGQEVPPFMDVEERTVEGGA